VWESKLFLIEKVEEDELINMGNLIDLSNLLKENKEVKIFINIMLGNPSVKTIRIWLVINNKVMVALIDTCNTYNFTIPKVAWRIRINIEEHSPVEVKIVNGIKILCEKYVQI